MKEKLILSLVRAGRTYVQGVLGFMALSASGIDLGVMPDEFAAALWMSAQLALAPTVMSGLQNIVELLGEVEAKWRG